MVNIYALNMGFLNKNLKENIAHVFSQPKAKIINCLIIFSHGIDLGL